MSTSIDKLAKELKAQMTASDDRKPKPYDTQAEVLRVEDGTAWVHIPGGVQETPVRLTMNAKKGDMVNVHVANGTAWITGNGTNPPTDDTTANAAKSIAIIADDKSEEALAEANRAKDAADRAEAEAGRAYEAAEQAVYDAGRAQEAAETAQAIVIELEDEVSELDERVDTAEGNITTIEGNITSLGNRVTTAEGNITRVEGNVSGLATRVDTAEGKVTTLEGEVDTLDTNVGNLSSRVSTAEGKVTAVEGNITTLQGRVADAEDDITDTLNGLALAQDIVGTVNWITSHSTITDDTTPTSGKSYYIKNQDGTFTLVTDTTGKNPHAEGWYELDEAMSNYVASHLALTNSGLCLTNDSNGWKVLVSSGATQQYPAGVYLIDPSGHPIQSTTADGISFDENKVFTIGNSTAFIVFDPAGNGGRGSITIGGSSIQIGDRTLEDVLGKTLIYDHTYEYVRDTNNKPVSANFTAFLYRGGVDVKSEYQASNFTWYLKKEEKGTGAVTETLIGTGYTCSVNLSNCGYGAEVIGKFTLADNANALTVNRDNLTDANNNDLSVRATGDSVRVRDLSVSSTIFPTDKLMVIGGEDEHLISVDSLQAYLNANLDKQVKFNTTVGWDSQTSLVSQVNTLYVYTDHQTDSQGRPVAGIKVGDGNAYVVDLPFTDAISTEHIADTTRHITASERDFWNNKVRCYYAGTEQLIFTTA